jgi:crossover junction endodeoxyribonuclease RuvC
LGIDPGLATTGWGVVEKMGSSLTLRALGVIETSSTLSLPHRLFSLRQRLAALLAEHQPHTVSMEQLFFTKFATSIAATAQARGVILLAVQEAGVLISEQNPRTVKIALTGFGSASKHQMQSAIQRHFRLKDAPHPDDAADAVAMAVCHLQTIPGIHIPVTRRSRAKWEAELLRRAS